PPAAFLDRGHDVLVPGAAAEIPLQTLSDLAFRRVRVALEQVAGGQDHAGRAKAALQTVLLPEGFLERMELSILGKPLDRRQTRAVGLGGEHHACLDRLTIHPDGAGTALARVTTDGRPRQAERLAQGADQQKPGLDRVPIANAVGRDGDGALHDASPLAAEKSRPETISSFSCDASRVAPVPRLRLPFSCARTRRTRSSASSRCP